MSFEDILRYIAIAYLPASPIFKINFIFNEDWNIFMVSIKFESFINIRISCKIRYIGKTYMINPCKYTEACLTEYFQKFIFKLN